MLGSHQAVPQSEVEAVVPAQDGVMRIVMGGRRQPPEGEAAREAGRHQLQNVAQEVAGDHM
jgi:hypothetical protein